MQCPICHTQMICPILNWYCPNEDYHTSPSKQDDNPRNPWLYKKVVCIKDDTCGLREGDILLVIDRKDQSNLGGILVLQPINCHKIHQSNNIWLKYCEAEEFLRPCDEPLNITDWLKKGAAFKLTQKGADAMNRVYGNTKLTWKVGDFGEIEEVSLANDWFRLNMDTTHFICYINGIKGADQYFELSYI